MKKGIILLVCVLAVSFGTSAQVFDKNALGLKFGGATGDFYGVGAQISYQRGLSSINRLELNLALNSNNSYTTFAIGGIYQWVWNIEGGFNWYVGPGASIGLASVKNGGSDLLFGLVGALGLEYRFPEVPIQLALDINPTFGLINDEGFYTTIGLGVRYCF